MSVPGVGPLTLTTVVAAIGTGEAFYRVVRDLELGSSSSRASTAPEAYPSWAAWPKFGFGAWLANTALRMHRNKLAAALANKLAHIAWSALSTGKAFDTARDRGGVALDL